MRLRSYRGPSIFFENGHIVDPINGESVGALRLEGGRITGVNESPQKGDVRFNLDGALVLPGLINAHDHLELNNFPRLKQRPCYANARIWSADMSARLDSDSTILAARAVPLADRLFLGCLKNLLAGTTTVAHHNPLYPPLRRDTPVRVLAKYGWSHSLYLAPDFAASYARTPRSEPWFIHLAEGTDEQAHSELFELDAVGALGTNTVLVHAVGLGADGRALGIERGAWMVWCPSSNFFLLGQTSDVRPFSDSHRLTIGSDSRLTGERDLLGEIKVACETKQVSAHAIFRAVTCDAAAALRLPDVGRILPGYRADLMILPRHLSSAEQALGRIHRADVSAVIVDGTVRIADPSMSALLPGAVGVTLDGLDKLMSKDLVARHARNRVHEPGLS